MKEKNILMKFIAGTAMLIALGMGSLWAAAADGKATYDAKCKMCHGADGKGNAAMVKSIAGAAEADTKAAVTKGKNKMKPVAGVTGKALDDVAAYVASLK
jgi:mono/diheme cytochrome c family protein